MRKLIAAIRWVDLQMWLCCGMLVLFVLWVFGRLKEKK